VNKGEKRELTVTYPEDYGAKDLAGKQILFKVHVKDVKLRELPELDDEFAKDLGEHSTLDELKKHIRERLEKDMQNRMEHFLREQAITRVTADSKVEIPPLLKARAAASIFEQEVENLVQRGANRDAVLAERDRLIGAADTEAERQLKLSFVTDEIAKRESLDVSDEELNKSMEEMIEESEGEDPRVRSYFNSERVRERYRDQLRVRKILDFVVSNATIEEVDEADVLREEAEISEEEKGDS
jgi:trigger factor